MSAPDHGKLCCKPVIGLTTLTIQTCLTSFKMYATQYQELGHVGVLILSQEDRINPPELEEVQESVPGSSSGLSLALGLSPMDLDSGTDPDRLHPDARLALRLWTVYAERVDPVLKILHIPTAQSAMIAMISGPKQTNHSLEALAFAVYFAAATSLSENEMSTISVDSRQGFLQKCKLGLNQAITKADFLNEPNMTTLQALAIFAVSVSWVNFLSEADHGRRASGFTTTAAPSGSSLELRSG